MMIVSVELFGLLSLGCILCIITPLEAAVLRTEPVLAKSGNFDDAVADSAADFSRTQGEHGWSYGYMVARGNHQPEAFKPLPQFQGGAWRSATGPYVTQTIQAPGANQQTLRRWMPSHAGSIRLVGRLRKPAGGGATCRVLVDGVERWSRSLDAGDTIPHGFDILLYDLTKGAAVDMVVGGSPIVWETQVLDEPCTAWRPDLPVGPGFSDAQKAQQRESGTAILTQINALSDAKTSAFTIPAGDYRFNGDWGTYPHIKNLHDVTLNAPGATFWFEPPFVHGLEFDDCRKVTIKSLTIDCDPLPFFQGRVTAIDRATGMVTAELMPGYAPVENSGNRTVSYYRPDGSYIRNVIIGCQWSRRPNSNLVEIKAPAPGTSVGDYLACVIRTGQQLRSINCGEMRFEDVNVYAGGGMAVMEHGGPGGSVYKRVRATRRPGSNRLHAFGADGFHFADLAKGPTMDRCEAAYLADDEINIHGEFGRIVKTLAPDHYLLSGPEGAYTVGQKVDFWSFVELDPLGDARLTKVAWSAADKAWDVTLDKSCALPKDLLIDTHTQQSGAYIIKNCWFHDTGQRFLINGAPDGIITNNTFQNIGGGISIHNESWSNWTEGAFPGGTVFDDNRLMNLAGGVVLTVNPGGRPGRGIRRSIPTKDVTIAGNYFEDVVLEIDAAQIDGLKIQYNVFDRSFADASPASSELVDEAYGDVATSPIRLAAVNEALVTGNLVYDPHHRVQGRVVTLGPLTTDIVVNGVAQWNSIADSLSSWYPETQGGRGWSFGTLDSALAQASSYQTGEFKLLPLLEGGSWKPEGNQYPFIGRTVEHPSTALAAVRRWVSTVSGFVRVGGVVQTAGPGNGTMLSVCVDGVRQWQQDTGDRQPHRFNVPLHDLKLGSTVDFVLDSKGDMDYDSTIFYTKILTPPGSG